MDYHKIQKVYSIWICPMPKDTKRKSSITQYSVTKNDILGKGELSGAYKRAADIDNNGTLDIIDIVKTKNIILNK